MRFFQRDLPTVLSLSFVDDLEFIATGQSSKEIANTLEKVSQIALKWSRKNAVMYDTAKTEHVLFSKARSQKQQLQETTVLIAEKQMKFNKKPTR